MPSPFPGMNPWLEQETVWHDFHQELPAAGAGGDRGAGSAQVPREGRGVCLHPRVVEIDLLRGGPRLPIEDLPECDYCVMVARPEEFPRVGIWPIALRDPLPIVPVPLRGPDPDAELNLKGLLDRVYTEAGYEDYIYSGQPQPPLQPQDAQWARQFLPSGGTK